MRHDMESCDQGAEDQDEAVISLMLRILKLDHVIISIAKHVC